MTKNDAMIEERRKGERRKQEGGVRAYPFTPTDERKADRRTAPDSPKGDSHEVRDGSNSQSVSGSDCAVLRGDCHFRGDEVTAAPDSGSEPNEVVCKHCGEPLENHGVGRTCPETHFEAAAVLPEKPGPAGETPNELGRISATLSLLRSVIQCREPWTTSCEEAYQAACTAVSSLRAVPVPADPPSALKETDFDIPRDNRFHPWTFPEKPAASAPEGEVKEWLRDSMDTIPLTFRKIYAANFTERDYRNIANVLDEWSAHRSALDAARIKRETWEEAAKVADEWDDQRFATNMDCYDFMLKSGVPEDTDAAWGKIETARAIAAALRERAKETR